MKDESENKIFDTFVGDLHGNLIFGVWGYDCVVNAGGENCQSNHK